ncbi:MAG: hypothetical protein Q9M89_07295 [Persephonella sp.]|nr:hypothetical protein [Persephonella sp.]
MKTDLKWKLIAVFAIVVVSIYIVLSKPIKLGLDLQGGMSIVLEVDVEHVIKTQYKQLAQDIKKKLKENNIDVLSVKILEEKLAVSLLDPTLSEKAYRVIKDSFPQVDVKISDGIVNVSFSQWELSRIKKMTVQQAVETIRNRIDEFGKLNANVSKLGERRILVEIPGVVDPQRAKSIIGKTAQLELLEVVDSAYSKEELIKRYPDGIPEGTKILEGVPEEINGQKVKEWFLVKDAPISYRFPA